MFTDFPSEVALSIIYLQKWLILLIIGCLYNLYNPVMSSVILCSGVFKPLIYATGTGCISSILLCWILSPHLGVGAAVVSLILFNGIVFCVTHFWYFPKYFKIKPLSHIINILLPPLIAGTIMCVTGRLIIYECGLTNNYINIVLVEIFGTAVYISLIMFFYISQKKAQETLT